MKENKEVTTIVAALFSLIILELLKLEYKKLKKSQ